MNRERWILRGLYLIYASVFVAGWVLAAHYL